MPARLPVMPYREESPVFDYHTIEELNELARLVKLRRQIEAAWAVARSLDPETSARLLTELGYPLNDWPPPDPATMADWCFWCEAWGCMMQSPDEVERDRRIMGVNPPIPVE